VALVNLLTLTAPNYWDGIVVREVEPDQAIREPEVLSQLRRESLRDVCEALSVELLEQEPRLEQALRLSSPQELEDYDPEDDGYGLYEVEEEPDPIGDESLPGLRVALFGDSSFEFQEEVEPEPGTYETLFEDRPFRLFGRDCLLNHSNGERYIDFGPWRATSFGPSHVSLLHQGVTLFTVTAQDMLYEGDFFMYVEGYIRSFFQSALREFELGLAEPTEEPEPLLVRVAREDLF
jgi:hypothetical protein